MRTFAETRAEFNRLQDEWKADTKYMSSVSDIFAHPAYQAILALGPDVIPCILYELVVMQDWWFDALRKLTGANPLIETEMRGNLLYMRGVWLNWACDYYGNLAVQLDRFGATSKEFKDAQ